LREEKDRIQQEVLRLLKEKYPQGLYEFLYKHRLDLFRQLIDLENRIDQTFLSDKTRIEEFKAVLREYWKLHMTAIKAFKSIDRLALNLSMVRQEMSEERIRA